MAEMDKLDKESPRMAGHAPLSREPESQQALEATSSRGAGQGHSSADELLGLQQTAGNAAVSSILQPASTPGDMVRDVISSPGSSLDSGTASFISSAVGRDVSDARIHTGPDAAAAAQSVDAALFTSGNHIVAPRGLDTHTEQGMFQTVHEFVHFGQQKEGSVDGQVTSDGLKISDPSDRYEQEADTIAAHAVANHADGGTTSAGSETAST